jgi:hypothetical protein
MMLRGLSGPLLENGSGSSQSTANVKWGYNDQLFRKEATKGQHFAEFVAVLLQNCGFAAYATPLQFANTIEDREKFINEQDIVFEDRSGCIEVKSRDLTFSGKPASYPFSTAFVDTQIGWNLKSPKPLAVVLVSQRNHHVLVIRPSTEPNWTVKNSFDRVRKINESWYQVNKSFLVPFSELCSWLRSGSNKTF